MAKELQVRRGALLMQRLGSLQMQAQKNLPRAPKSKGMWAFPYPYYEAFLTAHKWNEIMPKRLQMDRNHWPRVPGAYLDGDGRPLTAMPEFDGDNSLVRDDITLDPAWWEAREGWYATVGKKVMPLKKFWYDGYLYTHIAPSGEVGAVGTIGGREAETDWHYMHTRDLAALILKTRGDVCFDRVGGVLEKWSYSHDHLEVFIPAHEGKIS